MAKSTTDSRIMEQKDTISQLNKVISNQNELIISLQNTVSECNHTISVLQEQVDYLTQKLFGTSSEKSKDFPGQLNLFDEAEQEASPSDELICDEEIIIREYTRKAKRTAEDTFKGVPSRDVVIPLSDEQKYCADCGTEQVLCHPHKALVSFKFHEFFPAHCAFSVPSQSNAHPGTRKRY